LLAVTVVGLAVGAAMMLAGKEHPPDGKDLLTNTIGMKLKLIPVGGFQMGSPPGEAGRSDDEHPHRVRISQPFYMQTTEVTQGQWESVMRTTPWSGHPCVKEGTDYAASHVTWDDAVEFCRKLSAKEGVELPQPMTGGLRDDRKESFQEIVLSIGESETMSNEDQAGCPGLCLEPAAATFSLCHCCPCSYGSKRAMPHSRRSWRVHPRTLPRELS
jgi:hypothetical protein